MRSLIWAGWTGLGMALQVYKVELVLMLDSFAAFVAFVAVFGRPLRTCFCRLPFLVVFVILQLGLVFHLLFLVTLSAFL